MDWVIMPDNVSSDMRQDEMVKAVDSRNSPKISETEAETKSEWTEGNKSDFLTDDDEVSALIIKEVRKSLSQSDAFISDTGCTNDTTDQRRLFISDLTPIPCRWIKAGGGKLFSDFKGDVLLRCPDGSFWCQRNNAEVSFDEKRILFHDIDNKIIPAALPDNGLYKVDHIIAGPVSWIERFGAKMKRKARSNEQ
ncbi:hypothetical protein K3495_g2903 [Podosphaera aphanis]|nr:hypothetical protein K3495_g2903 [Podosphaera aphanis]